MERLKCIQCKNLLSYFPIYVHANKNENICGRCWAEPYLHLHLSRNSYSRNEAYEALAEYLKFACRYKQQGCSENLTPKEIPKHEDNCSYKIVSCPLINSALLCVWQGSRSQIYKHCEEKHSRLFLKNYEFKVVLSKSHECRNLLKWEKFIFLVTTKFESVNNMLKLSVSHLKDVFDLEECSYHVYFRNADRSLCIKGVTSSFSDVKTKAIFLDSLKNLHNESPTVSATFKFVKNEELSASSVFKELNESLPVKNLHNELPTMSAAFKFTKNEDPSLNSVFKEGLNEDLLSQLKCSICLHYALPPIYEYGEGKIKCSDCRDEAQNHDEYYDAYSTNRTQNRGYYQTGQKPTVPETRNFTLDKLASVLNYPCKYQKSGCKFVSKSEEMKKHQIACFFKVHECPINEYRKCEWKGTGKEMSTHIYNNHNDMITHSSQISECERSNNSNLCSTSGRVNRWMQSAQSSKNIEKCYIMNLSNRLYRLSFTIKNQHYYWELQTLDHLEKKFTYEVEIVNNNDQQQRLVARQTGSTLSKKDELFTNKNRCCILHAPDVEHFLSLQKEITFKVNIV